MCYLKKYDSPNLCLQTCSFTDLVDLDSFTCRSQSDCIKAGRVCDPITVACLSECPPDYRASTEGVCGRGCPSDRYLEESNSSCVLACTQAYIEKTRTCIRYLDYEIVEASQTSAYRMTFTVRFTYIFDGSLVRVEPKDFIELVDSLCLVGP